MANGLRACLGGISTIICVLSAPKLVLFEARTYQEIMILTKFLNHMII